MAKQQVEQPPNSDLFKREHTQTDFIFREVLGSLAGHGETGRGWQGHSGSVVLSCSEFQTLMQAPACTFTKPAMKAAIGGYGDFCFCACSDTPVEMLIFHHVPLKKAPESQLKTFLHVQPALKVPGSTDRRLSTLRLPVLSYDAVRRIGRFPSCKC